jgi:hypothetical protein
MLSDWNVSILLYKSAAPHLSVPNVSHGKYVAKRFDTAIHLSAQLFIYRGVNELCYFPGTRRILKMLKH